MAPGPGERPLLFLDVDGPLLPFGLPPGQYPVFPNLLCRWISGIAIELEASA